MKSDKKLEKLIIEKMIGIYCRHKHNSTCKLCDDCSALLAYSIHRIDKCPHSPKPKCRACFTHCFKTDSREKIKQVMKYSGPGMLFRHPVLTMTYYKKTRMPNHDPK